MQCLQVVRDEHTLLVIVISKGSRTDRSTASFLSSAVNVVKSRSMDSVQRDAAMTRRALMSRGSKLFE